MRAKLGPDAGDPWRLLEWNALLRGGVRFALEPDGAAGLRADLPLDDGADVVQRVRQACCGFRQGARVFRGNSGKGGRHRKAGPEAACDLAGLCTQAGWAHSVRADGTLAVPLDVQEGFRQATVAVRPDGGVLLTVEVARTGPEARAVALLLLSASRAVRMARPAAVDGALRLEAAFDTPPSTGEFAHALCALSVAWRLCGREAVALRQEALAKEYPGVAGMVPVSGCSNGLSS